MAYKNKTGIDKETPFEQLIKEKHLKYVGIAKELNVSTTTLWSLRQDPTKFDAVQLDKLSKILNIGVNELVEIILASKKEA